MEEDAEFQLKKFERVPVATEEFQIVQPRRKKKVTNRAPPKSRVSDVDAKKVLEIIKLGEKAGVTAKRIQEILYGSYVSELTGEPLTVPQIGNILYDQLAPEGKVFRESGKPPRWSAV